MIETRLRQRRIKCSGKLAERQFRLQQRFAEHFGALRCRELLRAEKEELSEAAASFKLENHCAAMIVTAVELTEEILREEKAGV